MRGPQGVAPIGMPSTSATAHPRWVRWLGWALAAGSAAAILALTLFPTNAPATSRLHNCLLCGERGLADALLNVILFLPLGISLALAGVRMGRATLAGWALSAAVELGQLWVVRGRDASMGDLLFNTLGTALGALLVQTAGRWMVPRGAALAARLALAAAVLAGAVVALTGVLLQPSFPDARYFVQWTPELDGWAQYPGRVVGSAVGDLPLTLDDHPDPEAVRRRFERGDPVAVNVVAGPIVPGLAPILRVVTGDSREIALVSARGADVVARYRQRGADWLLDQPSIVADDALRAVRPGAPLAIAVRRDGRTHCLEVDGRASCAYTFTAGHGWGLLMYVLSLPAWAKRVLDAAWVAALCLLPGLWLRRGRWESVAAAAVLAASLVVLPRLVQLGPTGPLEYAGALLGLLVGAGAGRLARVAGLGVSTPP